MFGRAIQGATIPVIVSGGTKLSKSNNNVEVGVRKPVLPRKVREDIRLSPS